MQKQGPLFQPARRSPPFSRVGCTLIFQHCVRCPFCALKKKIWISPPSRIETATVEWPGWNVSCQFATIIWVWEAAGASCSLFCTLDCGGAGRSCLVGPAALTQTLHAWLFKGHTAERDTVGDVIWSASICPPTFSPNNVSSRNVLSSRCEPWGACDGEIRWHLCCFIPCLCGAGAAGLC